MNNIKLTKKNILLALFLMSMLAFLPNSSTVSSKISPQINFFEEPEMKAVITNGIYIHNDAELASYSVSGDGSSSDPWIIRDLEIDTSDVVALRVKDTTEHFEIRNCTITAMYGIYFDNVTGGTSRIQNNTVFGCNSVAIYLTKTNGSWIEDNILIDNHRGMEINYCYVTHILNNYCQSRDAGIFLRYSPYSSLAGNLMYGDGVEFVDNSVANLLTNTITSTTVNDKPLLFSKSGVGSLPIGDWGQIIIIDGVSLEVENQDISNVDIAISIWFSVNINVIYCTLTNTGVGVEMFSTNDSSVTESTFTDCSDGIYMDEGYNNQISLNHFERCSNGFAAYKSVNLLVIQNNFYNNSQEAAYLDTCSDSQIYWNNFTDNNQGYIQAYDASGNNNTWYNSITQTGNWWSDHVGTGSYAIDGDTGSEDLYPLNNPYIIIPEFSMNPLNIWLVFTSVIFFISIIPIFRKRK